MIFKSLDIINFLSIAQGKVSLDRGGVIGVFGKNRDASAFSSNGSGKSAIWDALSWVLFGKTLRSIPVDGVKRKGTDVVKVGLTFYDDSKEYEVIRGRNNSGPFLHLKQDGKDVSSETQSDTQQKILSLIEMDWQTFTVSVIFGQDTFRFASATDKEQKQIFDKLLNIQIYDRALEACKGHLSSLSANLEKLVTERDKNQFLITNLEANLAQQRNALESQNQNRLGTLLAYNSQILELESKAKPKNCILTTGTKQAEIDLCRTKLEEIRDKVLETEKLKLEVQRIEGELNRAERELDVLQDKADRLGRKIIGMANVKQCDLCKQAINKEEADRQRKLIEDELATISADMKDYQNVLNDPDIANAVTEMKAQIAKDNWPLQKQGLLSKISVLQLEMDNEKRQQQQEQDQQARITTQIAGIRAKIEELSKPIQFDDSQTLNRIRDAKMAVNTLNSSIDEGRAKIDEYRFWEKGFGPGGIRSFLLDSVTPILNQAANRYANILLDGSIKIEFSTQQQLRTGELKDRFEVKAINVYGANVYEGNSAGERQRIDICIALALHSLAMSRNSRAINFLVFDEAFERLDYAGCERVMRLLKEIAKEKGSIFVTTHLENLASFFDTNIEILKEGGKSIINERPVEA